jgi:hypothetical protein
MDKPTPLRSIRLRVILQIAAAVLAAACIVGWSLDHYVRRDFSRTRKFEVSNQTREVLWNLGAPAKIILLFSPSSLATGSELFGDITALLREYQFLSHHYRDLTVEFVDPSRDPGRARDLQARYKLSGSENVLIVDYKDRNKVIPVPEMGEYDPSPVKYGEQPRLIAFRGEQVLTSALIGLVEPASNKKVYFLQGHGEMLPGVPPVQLLGQNLKRQNLNVAPLSLGPGETIPKDAALVAVAGAHFDLSEPELAALKTYWKAGGRLLVLLDPTGNTPSLDGFLSEAGITPRNDRVLRLVNLGTATGILRDVTGECFAGSNITARLMGVNILFAGSTMSLAIKGQVGATGDQEHPARPLVRAIHGFRGCTHHENTDGKGVSFDPVKDNFFPVIIAAMADLGGPQDDRVSMGASRMVVFGNCDFVKDKFLVGPGLDLLSSTINSLVDRTRLTGTTPKTKEFFTLNLDEAQLRLLALWAMGGVPLATALLGAMVLWRRRS